jgi:hypothetical protein
MVTIVRATIPAMKRRHWMDDLIRRIDHTLLVIVVVCFVLGGIGHLIHLIRFGAISATGGDFY